MFIVLAIANMGVEVDDLQTNIDEILESVRKNGIETKEFEKLINIKENQLVNGLGSIFNVSFNLAQGHVFFGSADYINQELDLYRKVKPEDIKRVANTYLNPNSRVVLTYLPKSAQTTE
jgi:zinc protease